MRRTIFALLLALFAVPSVLAVEPRNVMFVVLGALWLFFLIAVLLFIFKIFMLVDCFKRPFKSKTVWLVLLVLLPITEIVYYFAVKRPDRRDKSAEEPYALSMIAFITAAVGFLMWGVGVIGLVLGLVARSHHKKNPKLHGREFATASIILGAISTSLFFLLFIFYLMILSIVMVGSTALDAEFQEPTHPLSDRIREGTSANFFLGNERYFITLAEFEANQAVFMVNNDFLILEEGETGALPDGSMLTADEFFADDDTGEYWMVSFTLAPAFLEE